MIELYYTGSKKSFTSQSIPSSSLGGLISNSLIPNDQLGNIFGEISMTDQESLVKTSRVIAIRNFSDSILTDFKAWFTLSDDSALASYTIGYQMPKIRSGCSDMCSEILPSQNALPQRTVLTEASGEADALMLPDLEAGIYLFIFLRREINERPPVYTVEQLQHFLTSPLPTEELLQLNFSWA